MQRPLLYELTSSFPVGRPFCLSSQPLRQDSGKKADSERLTTRLGVLLCVYLKESVLESPNHCDRVPESFCQLCSAFCWPGLLSLTAGLRVCERAHPWFYVYM